MDTVTYPDSAVEEAMNGGFAALQIDLRARHPDFKEASLGQKVIWAPTFVFSDARHRELRRFCGWLPPESFLTELRFVQATAAFQATDFPTAYQRFEAIAKESKSTEVMAETMYWTGISGFLAGKMDWAPLKEWWGRLQQDYPNTRWARHASVIEDAPA